MNESITKRSFWVDVKTAGNVIFSWIPNKIPKTKQKKLAKIAKIFPIISSRPEPTTEKLVGSAVWKCVDGFNGVIFRWLSDLVRRLLTQCFIERVWNCALKVDDLLRLKFQRVQLDARSQKLNFSHVLTSEDVKPVHLTRILPKTT